MSEAEQYIAAATDHWLELLDGPHRETTIAAVQEAQQSTPLARDGMPLLTMLRPHFVLQSTVESVRLAASRVHRAIQVAATRLLADVSFRRASGLPAYVDPILDIDRATSCPSLMSRIDGMFDGQGRIQFIELNTTPGGFSVAFESDRAMSRAPISRAFARRFPFTAPDWRDAAVDAVIADARARHARAPVRIASPPVAEPRDSQLVFPYMESRGIRVSYVPLKDLEVRPDGVYTPDGFAVDIVNVDVNELLVDQEPLRPLCEAITRGLVRPLFGISRALLCSSKLTFAILSDPAHADMFDRETNEALRVHVPWTRKLRDGKTTHREQTIDLLPYVASHRDELVLKPAGSMGGEGVVVGALCEPRKWEATIRGATRRPYVVQERVVTPQQRFPMLVDGGVVQELRSADYAPFIWAADRVEGALVRVGRDVHNVPVDASFTALFVLDAAR
jgi:hypothetical protein